MHNITYTPKDSTWKVDNVEAAIDSLELSKTNLSIYTVSDRSGFGHFYITAQYTKTTDSAN